MGAVWTCMAGARLMVRGLVLLPCTVQAIGSLCRYLLNYVSASLKAIISDAKIIPYTLHFICLTYFMDFSQ